METSLSSIVAPADLLIQFLYNLRLIYFCGFFAYDGFKYGITLTHHGMRRGWVARLYAVFYSFMSLVVLLQAVMGAQSILTTRFTDIYKALSFAAPSPELGLIFIGLALVLFLFMEGMILWGRKRSKLSYREWIRQTRRARKFINWMWAMPLAIGIHWLIGFPYWVYVGIFAFFIYFAPLTSPTQIKKYFPLPADKQPADPNSPAPA